MDAQNFGPEGPSDDIRKSPEETLHILRNAHYRFEDFDKALRNAIALDPRVLTAVFRHYFDTVSRRKSDDLDPVVPRKATRHKGNNPSMLKPTDVLDQMEAVSRNVLRRFVLIIDDGRDFFDMTRADVEAWVLDSERNAALGRTALAYAVNIPYNKKMRDVLPLDFQEQLVAAWEERHKNTFEKYREQLAAIHHKTEAA